MTNGSISRRYAKALLEIGIKQKNFEALGGELEQFAELMKHKELKETLENPSYPLSKRKAIVEALIARQRPSQTMRNFILLLADRSRLGHLEGITREYQRMMDDYAGRIRAKVKSAQPLNTVSITRLKQAFEEKTGKKILLEQEVDPLLIAGMVTQIGSLIYDGSVKTQLEQMRQSLLVGEI